MSQRLRNQQGKQRRRKSSFIVGIGVGGIRVRRLPFISSTMFSIARKLKNNSNNFNKLGQLRTLKLFVRLQNGSLGSSAEALAIARVLEEKYGRVTSIQFARNPDTLQLLNHGWIEVDNDSPDIEKCYIQVPVSKDSPKSNVSLSLDHVRQSFIRNPVQDAQNVLEIKVEPAIENEFIEKPPNTATLVSRYEALLRFSGFKGGLDPLKKQLELQLSNLGIDTNQIQRNYLKELEAQTEEVDSAQSSTQEAQTKVSYQDYHTLATQSEAFTPATPRLQLSKRTQITPNRTSSVETPDKPVETQTQSTDKEAPQTTQSTQSNKTRSAAQERAFRAGVEAHKRALAMKEQEEMQRLEALEREKAASTKNTKKSVWNIFS
ncbi:hypothetical protein E3P99_01121 [Wallemia hederae]|uniref:Uncharacterized protein n=1 Tax=Wallemia hederae TaxID=1540922 RepID=A0A4V6TMF4_9BASI|nr:hypothetical protein E3P99_01121 [Wallemia hederae]